MPATAALQASKSIRGRSRVKAEEQASPFAHVETLREPNNAPARLREMWEVRPAGPPIAYRLQIASHLRSLMIACDISRACR